MVNEQLTTLQQAYAAALIAGDEVAAVRAVREAMEAGFAEAAIDDHVISPSMRLIGDLWADGALTVADERLATSISVRVLALQREAFRTAARRTRHPVLLACVQGEQHVVGLQMAASVLLHAGYDVRLLGADVPTPALEDAMHRHRPAVVGLSVTMAHLAVAVAPALDAIRTAEPRACTILGGAAADEHWGMAPDVVVCRHVSDAVDLVDGLVQRAAVN